MRYSKAKLILTACQRVFNGEPLPEVSNDLGVTDNTIRNWAKTDIWQDFEKQLLETEKEKVLQTQLNITAREGSLAQG